MKTDGQIEPGSLGAASVQQPSDSSAAKQGLVPEAALGEMCIPSATGLSPGLPASAIARIPVEIDVAIPIRKFRVRNLLALTPGQVIATRWLEGEDLPLGARGAQLAWTEFEVIEQKLAVRITRLI